MDDKERAKTQCVLSLFFHTILLKSSYQGWNDQRCNDDYAEGDSIPAEYLEIVFFHEIHQETNGKEGNAKSDDGADGKIADFRARHTACV